MHNWDNIIVISQLINTASPMKEMSAEGLTIHMVFMKQTYIHIRPICQLSSNDHYGQVSYQEVYILNTVMIKNYIY